MNKEAVYGKIRNCTKRTQIDNRAQYLNRVKHRSENKIKENSKL
jgi:hypothetical protein